MDLPGSDDASGLSLIDGPPALLGAGSIVLLIKISTHEVHSLE